MSHPMTALEKDAHHARLAEELAADETVPRDLKTLADDPRVTVRRGGAPALNKNACVVYWMQRAQRGLDNHALDKAINVANALGLPVVVYFACIRNYPHANLRPYAFLNQGLAEIEEECAQRNVGYVMRLHPEEDHERFFAGVNAAIVIGDENPMREPESWRVDRAHKLTVPFWTVDADVIVPSKLLEKAQFSAAVARPRLYRALPEFVVPFENPKAQHPWHMPHGLMHDPIKLHGEVRDITANWKDFDRTVAPVDAWTGGRRAGMKRLKLFCDELLEHYDTARNKPELDGSSKMSPYLHYGHLGPVTVALAVEEAVKRRPHLQAARDSYMNELVVWRELAINFVRYQPDYDSPACADNWARQTLAEHDHDPREVQYKLDVLERGETYDELWNAGQLQMVKYGWMHNYLRMYWAKKIVEWTPNVRIAMKVVIYLNDKYELDGRDPGGYAGIAWSMLGKFDRAWFDRPIFGKRRYMSGESTGRKFDSKTYIKQVRML